MIYNENEGKYQIGEKIGRKDKLFSFIIDGSLLTPEEENRLDNDLHRKYHEFFNRSYDVTSFSRYDMEIVTKIVEQACPGLTGAQKDLKKQCFCIKVINDIIDTRNRIMQSLEMGLSEDHQRESIYDLKKLNESLAFLSEYRKEFDEGTFGRGRDASSYKVIREIAKETLESISQDIKRVPAYIDYRKEKMDRFYKLRFEYERKSKFGKFLARINGQEKELMRAKNDALNPSVTYQEQGKEAKSDYSTEYQYNKLYDPVEYHMITDEQVEEFERKKQSELSSMFKKEIESTENIERRI